MNRFVITIATFSLFAVSCRQPVVRGKGPEKTEQRTISGYYNRIEIDAPVDANITIGGTPSFSVSGYANILPYIETTVSDSTLYIRLKAGQITFINNKNLLANITLPALTGVSMDGSGDIVVKGNVTGSSFNMAMSGSGSITADNVSVNDLHADLSGSGDIVVKAGITTKATYNVEGSGSIDAFGLQTTESSVDIAGSGDASVNASTKLTIKIAGSGDISYKGHPAITQNISGSGDVTAAN